MDQQQSNVENSEELTSRENQTAGEQNWQPRRRLLRGRIVRRGGRTVAIDRTTGNEMPLVSQTSNSTSSNINAENDEQIPNTEAATISPSNENNSNENNEASSSNAQGGASQIPEGIDPSFLAALPEEMRDEVIAEHLR